MRVSHGARPAAACSVSLRCHQSRDTDRTLLDDMETVFALVAFRRSAQFSGNQRQGADPGDEKTCGYDHDANHRARFAPLSVGSTLSYRQAKFAFFNPAIVPVGECPAQANARDRKISFGRLCLAEFYQHNPGRFWTVLSGPEQPVRFMPALRLP